ncbi:hypothetical protein HDU86_001783 [Geranomyces michiganensis]|nr:hypothetical protein HDU86_001783 [Geranomyces michiganensis]
MSSQPRGPNFAAARPAGIAQPRNPAAGFFKPPPRAPWTFYGIAFAFGFAMGSALEYSVVKAGYYDILRFAEARRVAKDRMQFEEANEKLDVYFKTGKLELEDVEN